MSAGTSWATVTCGWYGKESGRASGPRRTSVARSSQLPMPLATAMKTTSDTGANVPVPDRCISNGGWQRATSARWAVIAVRSATATSVGGSSVTCGGTRLACGSPTFERQSTSSWAQGSGTGTTMPTTVCSATDRLRGTNVSSFMGGVPPPAPGTPRGRTRRSQCGRRPPRPPPRRLPAPAPGRPGARGAAGQHPLELGGVVEQLEGAGGDGRDEVGDHLGELLLQVAVAAAGEVLLEVGDAPPGERAVDGQQGGAAGLVDGVGDDLAAGVGDGRADLLRRHRGLVEQVHAAGRRQALAHLLLRRLQVHDPRRRLRDEPGGHREGVTEAAVEPDREVAGELQVLALVVAHGHLVGLVDEDVGGHQDRVGEQAHRGAGRAVALALVLELRHPARLAE